MNFLDRRVRFYSIWSRYFTRLSHSNYRTFRQQIASKRKNKRLHLQNLDPFGIVSLNKIIQQYYSLMGCSRQTPQENLSLVGFIAMISCKNECTVSIEEFKNLSGYEAKPKKKYFSTISW